MEIKQKNNKRKEKFTMLFTHIEYIAGVYLLALALLCTTNNTAAFIVFKLLPFIFGILLLINKITPVIK